MSEQFIGIRSGPASSDIDPPQPGAAWRTGVTALYDAEDARLILCGRALGLSHREAEEVFVTSPMFRGRSQ